MQTITHKANLDRRKAAEYIGVSYHTLEAWARDRRYIPFYKNGRKVMYRLEDLDAHIERSMIRPED